MIWSFLSFFDCRGKKQGKHVCTRQENQTPLAAPDHLLRTHTSPVHACLKASHAYSYFCTRYRVSVSLLIKCHFKSQRPQTHYNFAQCTFLLEREFCTLFGHSSHTSIATHLWGNIHKVLSAHAWATVLIHNTMVLILKSQIKE